MKSSKYQKEREAWIVGVSLLGVMKSTVSNWWLQIPKEDPPDIDAMTLQSDKNEKINIMNWRQIEVMEITEFTKGSIPSLIKKKLEHKYYVKETALVVYLRCDFLIKDMRELSAELKSMPINVSDIWILGETNPDTGDFIFFSLYPEIQRVDFNLNEELTRTITPQYLQVEFKKGIIMRKIKKESIPSFMPVMK